MPAWVVDEQGVRVPVTSRGTLIGRDAGCALVLDQPTASRRHALLLHTARGTLLVPLGKRGVQVNEREVVRETWLSHSDIITLPGASLVLEVSEEPRTPLWVVELEGRRYHVGPPSFRVGGGDDDLVIGGWPPCAVVLHTVDGGLVADVRTPLHVAGRLVGADELCTLVDRDVLASTGVRLRVRRADGAIASTVGAPPPLPTEATLEFLPSGGVLRVRVVEDHAVFLADRRCDLVAALLQPPRGIARDEYVPDEVLIPRIWGAESAGRTQLNTLIHRVRKTLTRAGLNGATLLERAPGGRGTRFLLAPSARVEVL